MYFDRANNRYAGAVSLGHKAGKRVRRKVTGRTKAEVRAKLRQLHRELDRGVRSSAAYTVGDAIADWLSGGLHGKSERTVGLYRGMVRPLTARLGEVKLRDLTAGDVQVALGTQQDRYSVRREFRKITEAAGLGRDWAPREMRHTFVSLLSSAGTPLEDIAVLAGHKGTTTTETVYRKVIVPELRRAPKSWTSYSADRRPQLPRGLAVTGTTSVQRGRRDHLTATEATSVEPATPQDHN